MKYALVVVGLAIAGCGGGGSPPVTDADVHADAEPRPDAGDPCDVHEQDDASNDTVAEATGLTLENELRICGTIAARAPVDDTVDTDIYSVAVPIDEPVLVRLVSTDGSELATMRLQLAGDVLDVTGGSELRGVHAALAAGALAGTLVVVVDATNPETPAAEIAYEVRVDVDAPDTRCANVAGVPSYVEVSDGPTSIGNDVMQIAWGADDLPDVTLTTDPTDMPEASGPSLTVSAGMSYQATGSEDLNPTAGVDDYLDRDAYVIAAGSETNEMSIRVAWTYDGVTDLDVFLVPAVGSATIVPPALAIAASGDLSMPEFLTTSVSPSSTYWLWVGSYSGSTVPAGYTITLCGATFTP